MNQLYFGDNLDILKDLYKKHPEGFIDLIYIDPPFNSKRNYNVLFEDIEMEDTKAQKEAFADTWSSISYYDTLEELKDLELDLFSFINALDNIRISKGAIAYLTTMAIRIWYMHKLLKDTGSFYLHCDPTMSHYLKILCDLIFGEKNYKNEIIWQRTNAHNFKSKYFSTTHDIILFFTKSKEYIWVEQYSEYSPEQLSRFKEDEWGKFYKAENLTFSTANKSRQFEWRGTKPPANRSWGYSYEKLEELWNEGKILKKKDGNPRMDGLKVYLDQLKGKPLNDIWNEISRVGNTSSESLGYPTQKPTVLMERIITASSNEGDLVADFFCGCGTTIAAAQKLNRQWIGADISHLAVKLISKRLIDTYGIEIRKTFEIFGFPKDLDSARELAASSDKGRFKFEEWIIEVMLHGIINPSKITTGYDGYFTLDVQGKKDVVLIEVKSGNATLTQLNHFIQTVENKKGQAGVFVCFAEQVTRGMHEAAKKQGYYRKDSFDTRFDKIQILTVEELIEGKVANLPSFVQTTFKTAKKESKEINDQGKLF